MKFTTTLDAGAPRLGVVDGDAVIDLARAQPHVPPDLRAALLAGIDLHAAGRAALASAAPRQPPADLAFAPLLPGPGKTICLGLNYHDHATETGRDKPDYPWFFMRCNTSLMGHCVAGRVPEVSSKLDFEAELAVIIGTRVPRRTTAADALGHVFGYSCFNDLSVRDFQKRTPQWTIGKNFDATGGFGPVLVTADELPPGASGLSIQGRLNGVVMQDANTRDMIFGVAEMIALLSDAMTLEPGDVIVSGTPAGVGQARTPPVWLKAGDVYDVVIEGVGTLTTPIVADAG